MYKLKTKTKFPILDGRGTKSVIVRMITSHFSLLDINNVKVEGYYYYLDENNNPVKLPNSDFGQSSMKLWENIEALENAGIVPVLTSNINLKANLFQRLKELTLLQLQQEGEENYGIPFSEWVEDFE